MNYKEIGYRIQIAREEAGFNQKELAEILGISQASLSNYEKENAGFIILNYKKLPIPWGDHLIILCSL